MDMWKVQGVLFWTVQSVFKIWIRSTILITVMDWKGLLKAGPVMEWKGCHFENCRLALGVVFCRVNPLGYIHSSREHYIAYKFSFSCIINIQVSFQIYPIQFRPILIKSNSIDYLGDSNSIEVSHSTKKMMQWTPGCASQK